MAQRLVTKQKPTMVKLTGQAYRNFQSTEAAPKSKEQYEKVLVRFMKFARAKTPDDLLIKGEKDYSNEELEDRIAGFIESMKNTDLARATMQTALWGLKFFFEDANRRALAWGYLAKKIPKKDAKKTKAYTLEQIRNILKLGDVRTRALTLFFASTGVRVGALDGLRFKHLISLEDRLPEETQYEELREYRGLLVQVYPETGDQYFTFCTPEAAQALKEYRKQREAAGETITPESPVFRDAYDKFYQESEDTAKPLTGENAQTIFMRLQRLAGMRPVMEGAPGSFSRVRHEVKAVHGFRKFTDTVLTNCKLHPDFRKLLMGHENGLQENYYDDAIPASVVGALKEYVLAEKELTINEESRLTAKVQKLEAERVSGAVMAQSITTLQGQVAGLQAVIDEMVRKGVSAGEVQYVKPA